MKVEGKIEEFSLLDRAMIDDKTMILGSDEVLLGIEDLNTYGWKFFPKMSLELLELLPKDQKPQNKTESEILRKVLFPTISDEEPDESIGYFGSLSSGSQKLYMISVPKEAKKVTFYEGEEPKIKINVEDEKDNLLIWFVISGETVSDINLAYYSWLRNKIPHRNYKDHYIPIEGEHIDIVEKEGNYWMDLASGTMLSNMEVKNTPILDSILSRIGKADKWNHRVFYKRGDKVKWNSKDWIALRKTHGTRPTLSNDWILSDAMDKFKSDISIVSCSHGVAVPGLLPTPEGDRLTLESITLDYGYILDSHKEECFEAYLKGDLVVKDIETTIEKKDGMIEVPVSESKPKIECYINDKSIWSLTDDEGNPKGLSLGESFTTGLYTTENIGEIIGVEKSYIINEEIVRVDTTVDSLFLESSVCPILSDTVKLPCDIIRYNVRLKYNSIVLAIGEHPGYYVNTSQIFSTNSETSVFRIKPISEKTTGCKIEIVGTKAVIDISEGLRSDNTFESTVFKVTKEDDIFLLSVEKPTQNFTFNIYES